MVRGIVAETQAGRSMTIPPRHARPSNRGPNAGFGFRCISRFPTRPRISPCSRIFLYCLDPVSLQSRAHAEFRFEKRDNYSSSTLTVSTAPTSMAAIDSGCPDQATRFRWVIPPSGC